MTQTLSRLAQTAKRLRQSREQRDQLMREATEKGATRRQVAKASGLSLGRVQQIVGVVLLACVLALIGAELANASPRPERQVSFARAARLARHDAARIHAVSFEGGGSAVLGCTRRSRVKIICMMQVSGTLVSFSPDPMPATTCTIPDFVGLYGSTNGSATCTTARPQ